LSQSVPNSSNIMQNVFLCVTGMQDKLESHLRLSDNTKPITATWRTSRRLRIPVSQCEIVLWINLPKTVTRV